MTEPSKSKEDLRATVRRLSSRPPPDICHSEDNIPTVEQVNLKQPSGQFILVLLAVFGFTLVIATVVAWRLQWI